MYRICLPAVITAATLFLAACEPATSLNRPRWEQPDYSSTHSDAYFQHDPLYSPARGGP